MLRIRIKQERLVKILTRLDECYKTMMNEDDEPFFRERAETLYKEFLLRLALLNIPIEREEGVHVCIQPQTRRVVFLSSEEEMLERINTYYQLVLGGKKDAQEALENEIARAKTLGMEVKLLAGGYDFAFQFNSIFDIIPPYSPKMNTQKLVGSLKEKG